MHQKNWIIKCVGNLKGKNVINFNGTRIYNRILEQDRNAKWIAKFMLSQQGA